MDEVGSDVGREAEVDQNDWPCRKVPLVENGETVKRETEGDITLVFEVFVIECLTAHLDKLPAEFTVKLSIKHIRYGVRIVAMGTSRSIVQQFDDIFIEEHRLEPWANGEVLKLPAWLAGCIVSRFLTVGEWATVQVLVRASEATADFRTTV